MTVILHEDQYTFLIISRSVLLRMRNISAKIFKRKPKHISCPITLFSKIVPFMTYCVKIIYRRTGLDKSVIIPYVCINFVVYVIPNGRMIVNYILKSLLRAMFVAQIKYF
jgi:hypothetical protein